MRAICAFIAFSAVQPLASQQPSAIPSPDTLVIGTAITAVIAFPMPQGDVRAELRRVAGGRVRLRVRLPDASPSWRDGLAVFLDPVGDRTPMPGHDDTQLDFHRILDSSVVKQAAHGTWMPPSNDPDWRLGAARGMETWSVRVEESEHAWVLELLLDEAWLAGSDTLRAGLGLLAHDDSPNHWGAWPALPGSAPATRVERVPGWWRAVRLVQ